MPVPLLEPPSLGDTLGSVLIGTFIGLILLGVNLYQVHRYVRVFPGDPRWIKILVALTLTIEIVSSGMTVDICYHFLVTDHFHLEGLGRGTWSVNLIPFISGITPIITQGFFARRLWTLGSRYRPMVILSCVFYVAELATVIGATINLFQSAENPVVVDATTAATYLVPTVFALAIIANLILTISLIRALRSKRTAFKSTNSMLDVLIRYSLNTGLLNGVFDCATTIVAFSRPQKLLYAAPGIPAAKLYGITLLAALHTRRTAREKGQSKLEEDASDLVFGASSQATSIVDTGPPYRSGRMHCANPLRPTSDMIAYSDVIEIRVLSPPSPAPGIPTVYGGKDAGSHLSPRAEEIKASV